MTSNFFSQNLVAKVPNFEKLICNNSKSGTSVTKFHEKKFKVMLDWLNRSTPKSHFLYFLYLIRSDGHRSNMIPKGLGNVGYEGFFMGNVDQKWPYRSFGSTFRMKYPSYPSVFWPIGITFKAIDDIGVVMTPFWDVVTVILVVNSYVFAFLR